MGTSTDGQICFGLLFEEEYEFPWSEDDDELDDWWLIESGWKWHGEEPFTPDGDYAPGFGEKDPRITAYFDSRREWRASHPCPVTLVNYQSGKCPAYILACPSTLKTARRGFPVQLEPAELTVPETERLALLEFCERYGLTPEGGLGWYLSSYWG